MEDTNNREQQGEGIGLNADALRGRQSVRATFRLPAEMVSLPEFIVECKKKLYKTMLYNGVGWVDKPNVSDGLCACWVSTQPTRCVTFSCIPLYLRC